jgi:hypothetical protein
MTLEHLFLLNSLWIWGLYIICNVEFLHEDPKMGVDEDSKEIFWFVKVWVVKKVGLWYSKPIITCPVCMSSIHSAYFYLPFLFLTGFTWIGLLTWIPYMICLAGFQYLIAKLTHR